tara:strand:+ start:296 stop:514 length:219 start_codon:yes stop_codon:yes gene_type:complete
MKKSTAKKAATKQEWWNLVRADWIKWESKCHQEDSMGLTDFAENQGACYGWEYKYRSQEGESILGEVGSIFY